MKKNQYSYIGVAFIILLFGIIFVPKIVNRFKNNSVVENDRLNTSSEQKHKSDLFTVGECPKFKLVNENGDTITNDFYKGKVFVVEFFFSTCPSICPVMNENMKEIEAAYGTKKDFGIASITINPEYDTPKVLKEHKAKLGIASENWNFLTGNRDYIFDLANKGFRVFAGANSKAAGGFEHSGSLALVDKDGKIRCRKRDGNPIYYYSGVNYSDPEGLEEDLGGMYKPDMQALKEDIKILLAE